MSAMPTSNKRERRSVSPASARHSGEGRNPVTGAFRRGANVQDRIGDALPTSLPEGWRWATLGDTGRYINGVAFKPSDWVGEGLPIIRIQNLTDPQKPLNRTMREVDPIYRVETGDLLVSWSATLDAFLWDREPGLLNQHIFKVVPDENVVGKRFLFYLLKMAIAEMIKSEHLHGSTMKHINRGPFLAHKVLIPTLTSQEKIVAEIEKQFTRLDAGVAALRRVQANLKRYRAAVLKAACEGRLVPTEAELAKAEGRTYETGEQLLARILADRRKNWRGRGKYKEPAASDAKNLPPIPGGWAWARLEQLGVTYGGLTKNPKRARLSNQLPYLRVANVYANELRLSEIEYIGVTDSELEKLLVRVGDLLIVEGNGSKDQIGRLAIWDGSIDPCVHQNHLIKVRLVDPAMSKLILYWLQSTGGRHFVELIASSTSGLYTLSVNKVGDLPILLPPLAEQTRIVAEVERCLSVVGELEAAVTANLRRATRLRQATLQRAFNGY